MRKERLVADDGGIRFYLHHVHIHQRKDEYLQKIEERQSVIMSALYIMSDNTEIQDMIESYEEEE